MLNEIVQNTLRDMGAQRVEELDSFSKLELLIEVEDAFDITIPMSYFDTLPMNYTNLAAAVQEFYKEQGE